MTQVPGLRDTGPGPNPPDGDLYLKRGNPDTVNV